MQLFLNFILQVHFYEYFVRVFAGPCDIINQPTNGKLTFPKISIREIYILLRQIKRTHVPFLN
jgi:hypothetical protein